MQVKLFISICTLFCINTRTADAEPDFPISLLNEIINISPILRGIQIPDELKRRLLNCVGENGDGNFPEIPLSEDYKKFLDIAAKLRKPVEKTVEAVNNAPIVGPVISVFEKARKTFITDPLSNLQQNVVKGVESVPDKITEVQAWLAGAQEEAESLIRFSNQIVSHTQAPNPLDPYQDISGYLKAKQAHNVKSDLDAAAKNKKELASYFADSDPAMTRKFGAKVGPFPDALLLGFIKTLIHT